MEQSKYLLFGKELTSKVLEFKDTGKYHVAFSYCFKNLKIWKQEGNDGPGFAHLSILQCDSKILSSDLVFYLT